MQIPQAITEIFGKYSKDISHNIQELLGTCEKHKMYDMMGYFMGFRDEKLQPQETFGGKRFRSSLCLLIADIYGHKDQAQHIATSIELFHNFTLIHDDIVDEDELRRGRPTVWKLWSMSQAINTGDVQALLAHKILAEGARANPEKGLASQHFLIERYLEVGEGQYLDLMLTEEQLESSKVTEEMYFEMVTKKSAVLVGAATKVAGMVSGLSEEECEALWEYGLTMGVAYQLFDDMTSLWGDVAQTGKHAYGDIQEKKKTLPIIYALKHMRKEDQVTFVRQYDANTQVSKKEAQKLLDMINTTEAYAYVAKQIDEYSHRSHSAIEKLSCPEEKKEVLRAVHKALLPPLKLGA